MSTYTRHITAATRYAATALTLPAPTRPDPAEAVRLLQDDAAGLLAEMTEQITGLSRRGPRATRVTDLARHPVRILLTRLAALPAKDGYAPGAPSPLDRLTGRPATPAGVSSPLGAWQGIVAEIAQARDTLTPDRTGRCSDEDRWAVVADVAALAQVLAATRTDLLTAERPDTDRLRRDRSRAAALGVEAREVARLAATPTRPAGPDTWTVRTRPATSLVMVTTLADIHPAAARLARLVHERPGNVTDLLAITTLLAQTSRACARALRADTPTDALVGLARGLDAHAAIVTAALAADRPRLAAFVEGSPLLLAQAREIGAAALPRLDELARSPRAARAAREHVLRYAVAIPTLTMHLSRHLQREARTHGVAVRDRATETTPARWRPATAADLSQLRGHLTHAAAAATVAIPRVSVDVPAPAATKRQGRSVELDDALERRRAALRPTRPSVAALTGRYARVGRAGATQPATWM